MFVQLIVSRSPTDADFHPPKGRKLALSSTRHLEVKGEYQRHFRTNLSHAAVIGGLNGFRLSPFSLHHYCFTDSQSHLIESTG
jgi:hypothetical protein